MPTPEGTTTVRAPELEPLGSGFSLFSPEGALIAALATLAALMVGGGVFYVFRHSRLRAKQARFDAKIFQAVQDIKEKTQLIGPWSPQKPASF